MSQLLVDAGAEASMVEAGGARFLLHRAGVAGNGAGNEGGSPPALLLHGVPQTAACWRDVLAELSTDRTVLAPDLKGLGGSGVAPPYDVATLTRELAALVEAQAGGPVDAVGHDWGGVLALALAGARPDLVRRLVVVNAPYRYVDFVHAAHIPAFSVPLLPELAFALGGRRLVHRMIGFCWKADRRLDERAMVEYADAYADPARVRAMLGYYRALFRPRAANVVRRGLAGGLKAPASKIRAERRLVVWGALDPVLPLPVGEAAARDLADSTELVTVPGAGHFVVEEAPEIVVRLIADFLRAG